MKMYLVSTFLLLVLSFLSFSVRASGSHDLQFTAKERYEDVSVAWIVSNDVVQTCNMANRLAGLNKRYDRSIMACAVVYRMSNTCVIYTAPNLSLAVLGHEVRHCFEGAWHE